MPAYAPVIRNTVLLIALLCLLLSANLTYARDNAIVAIDTVRLDNRTEINIRLRFAPEEQPASFSMLAPPGIVIDFPATENATGIHRQSIGTGLLRGYAIANSAERSRIVLQLDKIRPYTVRIEASTVVISILDTTNLPMRDDASIRSPLGDIGFRAGPQGEGRVLIGLPGPATALDVKRQGTQIIADLFNVDIPAHQQRRLDVSDFGTPVKFINVAPNGTGTRIVMETKGMEDHHVYQKDMQLTIDAIPSDDTRKRPQPTNRDYRGEKLSLQFQNVEVRAILQVLADFTGINIIASDSVGGTLTLRLKDVPWDQALDIVLQARGLDMRRNGNVMRIAPRDELLAKERQELEQRAQIAELEPLHSDVFQLNYQKAETFRKVFGENNGGQTAEHKNSLLSRRGSAVVDQRTNQLFVTDTPTVLDNIRKLLDKIDIASRQVQIEARIVEADDTFSRNLGMRLGFSARTNGLAVGNSYNSVGERAGLTPASADSFTQSHAVNLPAASIGGAAPGSFALSLFNAAANRFLNLELSALEADGKGKIISSPRVVTADQQAALIEQGEEIPYQQATSSGATSTAFKKANLKLEVTPQITPNGNVILSVDINKDSRGTATPGGLAINTKHVKTLVQVENGGTVVIGGIFTQTVSDAVAKVPLLGDIPVLGYLFKNTVRIDNKTELLIFLTPKILAGRSAGQ